MRPMAAIKASKELMRGNKWRLFCLQISFIGWSILANITVIGGIFLPAAASLISTGFNTLRKVESDDRTQVVIGLSLLLGIALPNALSGLEGGAHVFFSNSILVGAFSVVILKALIIDLPNFIARHADERTKQAE